MRLRTSLCQININLLIALAGFPYLWLSINVDACFVIPFSMIRMGSYVPSNLRMLFTFGDDHIVIDKVIVNKSTIKKSQCSFNEFYFITDLK